MYAQLGNIVFDVKCICNTKIIESVEYATHRVIDNKQKMQVIGDNIIDITLDITLHTNFCNVMASYNNLKSAMLEHAPLSLIFGTGEYKGKFIIEKIEATKVWDADNGNPLYIDLTMSLLEWATDTGFSAAVILQQDPTPQPAISNAANNPSSIAPQEIVR